MQDLLVLKPDRILKPEDFKAQLYFGLIDSRGWWMMPRVRVEWGQQRLEIEITEPAIYKQAAIYDYEDGGEILLHGDILFGGRPPDFRVFPHDSFRFTEIGWP